jgi:hypothetical protein
MSLVNLKVLVGGDVSTIGPAPPDRCNYDLSSLLYGKPVKSLRTAPLGAMFRVTQRLSCRAHEARRGRPLEAAPCRLPDTCSQSFGRAPVHFCAAGLDRQSGATPPVERGTPQRPEERDSGERTMGVGLTVNGSMTSTIS